MSNIHAHYPISRDITFDILEKQCPADEMLNVDVSLLEEERQVAGCMPEGGNREEER